MSYSIRKAQVGEIYHLVEMGYAMHRESPTYRHMNYDHNKCAHLLKTAIDDDSSLFLRVIVDGLDDAPVGLLLACISSTFFGTDRVAHDMLLMLSPDHRGKCHKQLQEIVRDYKGWARERDAKVIWLSTSTGIEVEKTSMLFAYLGFPAVGKTHAIIE